MNRAKHIYKAEEWIDPQCYSYPHLNLVGNKIQARNQVDIFGKQKLKNKYRFTVTTLKIVHSIGIGIIDEKYKDKKVIRDFSDMICYCNDGLAWDGRLGKFNGKGFKEQESVTVEIDFDLGNIKWRVEDEILYEMQCNYLKNQKINWVPYLWLCKDSSAIITN